MKQSKASRPNLPKVSEQMKAWSAALAGEVSTWPQVNSRPFFGFTALYRNESIFALLPRTRALETPNSLAFKIESPSPRLRTRLQQDSRIGATEMQKARWFTFETSADADLRDALGWLQRAYTAAAGK
jgi:hypothetical protein